MKKRIAIVDDEPAIAAALTIRLEAMGYEIQRAHNGRAGIELVSSWLPDAAILDVRMPDIDGFEVCQHLRAQESTANIPVLFLSANVKEMAKARAFAVGGDAYLSKPYNAAEVVSELERCMHERAPATGDNAALTHSTTDSRGTEP